MLEVEEAATMKTVVDPKGREDSPILHRVAKIKDGDGRTEVLTLCDRWITTRSVQDSELSQDTIDHLCGQCRHLAKIKQETQNPATA